MPLLVHKEPHVAVLIAFGVWAYHLIVSFDRVFPISNKLKIPPTPKCNIDRSGVLIDSIIACVHICWKRIHGCRWRF